MLTTVFFVAILMLPGMDEPKVVRTPMDSFAECLAKVTEAGAGLKAHEGEAYHYMAACDVTGSKADPA